jgi:hypothetical protein
MLIKTPDFDAGIIRESAKPLMVLASKRIRKQVPYERKEK